MKSAERDFRKQLLLVKGDALRMHLQLEIGQARQRLSTANAIATGIGPIIALVGMLSGRRRGWWPWFKSAWNNIGTIKSLLAVFRNP